jgi:hypothetical protein
MSRRWASRALVALGIVGLAACIVSAATRVTAISHARERDRTTFEQHRGEAGECETSVSFAPHYRDSLLGFRCARSAERAIWATLVTP